MSVTNWISASGGNISNSANWDNGVPSSTVDMNIGANILATGKTITIDAALSCKNFIISGSVAFTLASSVYTLSIYGNLTDGTNCLRSFTGTAYLYFAGTGSQTITSNGNTQGWNQINFNGVGGTWTNQDDWNVTTSLFVLTNGTWNTNGKTISTDSYFLTQIGTKTLTLGASIFNIRTWTNSYPTGFTFNYNTSTVNLIDSGNLTNGQTFYNLIFTGNSLITAHINLNGNITVKNNLTITGNNNSTYRLLVQSDTIGTARTITYGNLICTNTDFQDITLIQSNGGLVANDIDNLIIDLNNSAWAGSGKTLYLKGSNAAPTAASAAARAALVGKGVTISTN